MVEATAHEGHLAEVTFEEFSEEWLREFVEGSLTSVEKGERFAAKLVTQWLNVTDDDDNLEFCGGPGDGGIDVAYLCRPDIDDDDQEGNVVEGSTWYLIQSKYGTAFQGAATILSEGLKVLATLSGENKQLNDQTKQLVERLDTFREGASEGRDRVILVFATTLPMTESDRQALNDLRTIVTHRFSNLFDVQDISLQTIWESRVTTQPPGHVLPIGGISSILVTMCV